MNASFSGRLGLTLVSASCYNWWHLSLHRSTTADAAECFRMAVCRDRGEMSPPGCTRDTISLIGPNAYCVIKPFPIFLVLAYPVIFATQDQY